MHKLIYQAHILLGLLVAIPVLAWSLSGFLYALPDTIEGSKYEAIDETRIGIGPTQAIEKARTFAGTNLPVSSLTLQKRNGIVEYLAISGTDSILINAETGEALKTPPPGIATRFFREAHFYFFLYPWNVALILVFTGMSCLSVLSGFYLNIIYWSRRLKSRPATKR